MSGPGFRHADPFGLRLLLPAIVIGAFGGNLLDMLLWDGAYPLTKAGIVVGPAVFALSMNALSRWERARAGEEIVPEAYRRAETEKRMAAAQGRGELVRFEKR